MAAELAPALAELELPVAQRAQELELRPALELRRALVEARLEPSPVEREQSPAQQELSPAELELSPVELELSPAQLELSPVAELRPVVVKLQLSPVEAVAIR
jgi:hypothetical protein